MILLIGNYMNAGSRNEQTIAFEFSFITKVIQHSCVLLFLLELLSVCFIDTKYFTNGYRYGHCYYRR